MDRAPTMRPTAAMAMLMAMRSRRVGQSHGRQMAGGIGLQESPGRQGGVDVVGRLDIMVVVVTVPVIVLDGGRGIEEQVTGRHVVDREMGVVVAMAEVANRPPGKQVAIAAQ